MDGTHTGYGTLLAAFRNIDRVFEGCIDVVFKISMEKVGFM